MASKKTHITVGIRTVGNSQSNTKSQQSQIQNQDNNNQSLKIDIKFAKENKTDKGWYC